MPAASQPLPPRAQAALSHLRRLKPLDGYSVESYLAASGRRQLRLKRRNIPVADEGFADIVLERTGGSGSGGRVVGIRVLTSRGDAGRGVVLVHADGKVCSDAKEITVDMKNTATISAASQGGGGSARNSSSVSGARRSNSSSGGASSTSATAALSDADSQLLLQYGLMALGALLVLKLVFAAINVLAIVLLPALYLYASANCPTIESFEAKRELKRVMRGTHLPEEMQPKGFFEQGLNRIAASVTTELATSLGYEMSMTDCLGAAKLATLKVPLAGQEFYWLGVMNKWRYVGSREIPGSKTD
ncbi:hypothetical protein ACHAXT_001532 [Thalassiosira profunda]